MKRLIVLAAAAALLTVPAAAAKKPVKAAATGTAAAAATYDPSSGTVSVSGCGYQFAPAWVVWTAPDGTTVSEAVGMSASTCLDTNYTPAPQPGDWTVQVFQIPNQSETDGSYTGFFPWLATELEATATVAVP